MMLRKELTIAFWLLTTSIGWLKIYIVWLQLAVSLFRICCTCFGNHFCRKILSTLGPVEPLEKFEMERWPGFSFGQLSWMHRADARHVSSHPDVEDISWNCCALFDRWEKDLIHQNYIDIMVFCIIINSSWSWYMSLHENMLSRGGLNTLFFIDLTFYDPDLIKCEYFSMTVLMDL